MAEKARIAKYFAPLSLSEPGSFALTDDAALLTPPEEHQVVVTTDSVIAGIHVLPDASAAQIAQKLVRRNLSDLAAMGAEPWRYFLNLHTPTHLGDEWFAAFSTALRHEQEQFGMVLAGGDSTSGGDSVHATLTCLGLVPSGALLRSTAAIGDDVYVSGTIGDAALGLRILQQTISTDSAGTAHLTKRYHTPEPRLALGSALRGVASACIDVSDGLLADAGSIAEASVAQLQLRRDAIPLSHAAQGIVQQHKGHWETILTGGDDYELLFTAAPAQREALASLAFPITRIGTVVAGSGVLLDGQLAHGGWQHA